MNASVNLLERVSFVYILVLPIKKSVALFKPVGALNKVGFVSLLRKVCLQVVPHQ